MHRREKMRGEMLKTKLEKALPPVLTYFIRKIILYGVKGNIRVLKFVSGLYCFDFAAGVSDRQEWIWLSDYSLPRYRLEKEN